MLIHGFVNGSLVNGPGLRAMVYFQGCQLACVGCWNEQTHAFAGKEFSVAEVTGWIQNAHRDRRLDGVTFSGGEPMQQAGDLLAVMESAHDALPALSFGLYSGYTEPELADGRYWSRGVSTTTVRQDLWRRIRNRLDFAVLGRYAAGRSSALPLRTSANQTLALFSGRYREQDFEPQGIEVHIGEEGFIQVTGFPINGLPV